jgi:hypothetical protein
MTGNDLDRDAIDLLVRDVMAGKAPAPQPVAAEPAPLRPGTRWTNVRMQMPAKTAPGLWKRFEDTVAVALPELPALPGLPRLPQLPELPDVRSFIRMPGPVAVTRMWVGLGALYSFSMTFWPYQRTYVLGLALYMLALGLLVVAGVWGARLSWDGRLGAAHTIAVGTVLWSITLATIQTVSLI